MKNSLIPIIMGLLILSACDSFVENIEDPIDSISEEQLQDASQLPFVITGVEAMFAETYDDATILAGGLSDELFFDQNVQNATFPTYRDIDRGEITLDNNSVDDVMQDLGEYRLLADDLLNTLLPAVEALPADGGGFGEDDADLRNAAYFTGHLHGGIARYFYAAYFGLSEESGGGVIDRSEFIPSAQMYDLALEELNSALEFGDAAQDRVVRTIMARINLIEGDFAQAQTNAEQGMQEGDDPFEALFSTQDANNWYFAAGRGRTQYVVDDRFATIAEGDPRVVVETAPGAEGTGPFFRQAVYTEQGSSIPFVSWQENSLMLAELAARAGDSGAALQGVNAVRASHTLEPLGSANLDAIIAERERELFVRGIRLLDQRRLGDWHLPGGTWRFLPITERERNDNPNL